jgi:tRNA (adenine22-N1)-methyltransferase
LKLSKRLKQIEAMVLPNYTHIWDCCCDHGFLGATLLSKRVAQSIHFVDIVPKLIDDLEVKLERFYPNSVSNSDRNELWKTHCIDVSKLPLSEYKGSHLVIIAGIGGDLMNTFIKSIYNKHKDLTIDFLLCPVHHQFSLRQNLISLNFSLKHEVLIEEKQRFYEIILVSSSSKNEIKEPQEHLISMPKIHTPINPVGDFIWQYNSVEQAKTVKNYLNKTLKHYARIKQNNNNDIQHIIDAYQAITL